MNNPSRDGRSKDLKKAANNPSTVRHWPSLARVMIGRLVLLAIVFALLTIMLPHDAQAFYAFIALAFVVNIPYALWLRRDSTIRSSAPFQFLVDTVVITGLVHFTGGISSELFLLYPLVILSAGIVISGSFSLKMAMMSIFSYSTLVLLELQDVLPHYGPDAAYENSERVIGNLTMRVVLFVFFSAASQYLASRCTYQAKKLQHYQTWITAVFNNVSMGIITLTPEHEIIFVNRTAANWLEMSPESLMGQPLASVFIGKSPTLRHPQEENRMWKMITGSGGTLPAGITVSRARFPVDTASTENSPFQDLPEREVIILAIRDLTREMQAEESKRQAQQLITAFQVGSELAHSVRNPLTSIQCGCDGIRQIVRGLNSEKPELGERERKLMEQLATIIGQQAESVSSDLERFLLLATQNPETLVKMASDAADQYFPKNAAGRPPRPHPPQESA